MLSVNRGAERRLGLKAYFFVQTGTQLRFIKKIKYSPLKPGVHLQWEIRGGRSFYVCQKGGLWYENSNQPCQVEELPLALFHRRMSRGLRLCMKLEKTDAN